MKYALFSLVLAGMVSTAAMAQEAAPLIEIQSEEISYIRTDLVDEDGLSIVLIPVSADNAPSDVIYEKDAQKILLRQIHAVVEKGNLGYSTSLGFIVGKIDPQGGIMASGVYGLLVEATAGTRGGALAMGYGANGGESDGTGVSLAAVGVRTWNVQENKEVGTYAGIEGQAKILLFNARAGLLYRVTNGEKNPWMIRFGGGFWLPHDIY